MKGRFRSALGRWNVPERVSRSNGKEWKSVSLKHILCVHKIIEVK